MRYLINKPVFKELILTLKRSKYRPLCQVFGDHPSLRYNTLEYRLMYSRPWIAVAELYHFNDNNQSHGDYGFQESVVFRRYCLSSSGAGFAARWMLPN